MANLPEDLLWQEGIYQIEENDDVRGGPLPAGISNLQAKQLADRTVFLRAGMGKLEAGSVSLGADMVEGYGRDLMKILLGHGFEEMTTPALISEAIAESMAKIRIRMNNNGEIDGSGIPDIKGLQVGDYLDGLDLSAIAAPTGGSAPQAWSNAYKNNRLILSGMNPYKGVGDTEKNKNSLLITTRNSIARGRMNPTDTNAGGYKSSEMRVWLEGASGDGSGVFATGLKAALGGDYLYTIRKGHVHKGSSSWDNYTVWLPTEIELFGNQTYGDELTAWNTNLHYPIYQKSYVYRIKRWNGSRDWYFLATAHSGSSSDFCSVSGNGNSSSYTASSVGGCAPAFCVL